MKTNKAVFLDLNGTLVLPLKQESFAELKLISGAGRAVARLLEANFICPVVTIQSGIGKGRFTDKEFRDWFFDFFGQLKLDVKGPYICPHRFVEPCECKKTNPFLYEHAATDHAVDLSRSYVIGDTAWDVIAGKNIGGRGCLVRTGWGENETEYQRVEPFMAYSGKNLSDVVGWILKNEK
ncbi:HAD-IIIA family hydrolase [Mucilaginibacter sp.]|uniref:HAD-IIIA family hydrolase n=1 Tax=Mucilaginibacter sp. TaxID=1882438 RepID=UPI0026190DA6|nr:HAD-IIIA family hydrolase [Mucilaginibacter sp.]MDB4923090.1 gmhB [Mucilaginibacter sp.]